MRTQVVVGVYSFSDCLGNEVSIKRVAVVLTLKRYYAGLQKDIVEVCMGRDIQRLLS